MWFGNMVTMKWWGDLWLNESFATFLAYYALENCESGFPGTMLKFCKEVKHLALFEDQLSTTHPIMLDCPDTDTAFENFDGITYQKGAAVLFQLLKLMGEDNFKLAIHRYLKDGAWRNSEPEDLIKSFSPYCSFDFRQWFQDWFAREGVNNVRAEVIAENDIIKNIKLLQGSDSGQTLRSHTACMALVYDRDDKNAEIKSADIFYEGECTENTDFCQQKAPDFIFCNYRDYDYVNCVLSESSLNWLKRGKLCSIDNELLRMQIWNSLIDMVNNRHLSPLIFCELSLVYADKEKNDDIFTHFMRYVLEFMAGFYPDKKRKQDSSALFELARKELETNGTKLSVDRQKLWFMYLIFAALREEDFNLLCQFTDQEHFFGIKLDIEMRWQIIKLLALHRHKRFPELLEDMQKRDKSNSGLNQANSAKALFTKDKKSLFNDIFENNELSVNRKTALMRAVFHHEQLAESTELVEPYFTRLAEVCRSDDKIFRQYCINYMFPFYHTEIALQHTSELVNGDFPESLKKLLKVKIEMMQRRLLIMEKFFGEKI
jgi:aminopeptidase N